MINFGDNNSSDEKSLIKFALFSILEYNICKFYNFMIIKFMDKKVYLLKILTQLEPIRDLAKWLKILVEQWNLDDNVLEVLINAVQWAVSTAKSDLDKQKLQKWLDALEKMKEMEEESKMQDEKDLEELDKLIDSF